MDIDLLSKMVYDLILDNDRVALPGVGCFVAEIVPASFSDKGYTINPPYRKLYFRSKPDDGELLVKLYAKSNGVAEEDARRILTEFLAEMRDILFTRKVIVFPGLGRLRATRENNLFFVADEALDIYPEGFGLEPLSLKTHKETEQELSATMDELGDILGSGTVDEPVVESVAESVAEPVSEPSPVAEPVAEPTTGETRKMSPGKIVLITLASLLGLAAVLFGIFVLLVNCFPDFLDSLLYTKEELYIINYRL